MSVSFEYDIERKVVIAKVSGLLSIEVIKQCVSSLLSSSDFPPDADTVWDLTEMEFHNVDYAFAQQLVELRKTLADRRGNARLALVSDYEPGKPLLELYQILSGELAQEIQTFSSHEEAIGWLACK